MTLAASGAAAAAQSGARRAWDFGFTAIEGGSLDLSTYRGRVLLVVNTASFCGYTPQYKGLEQLHESLNGRGLTVVGVPSGDFNQESDSNAKVKHFCEANFGIAFPLTTITHVEGPEAHPFYRWVKAERGWEPSWNFNKVLIGRDGGIAGVFGSGAEPGGKELAQAIETALGAHPAAT